MPTDIHPEMRKMLFQLFLKFEFPGTHKKFRIRTAILSGTFKSWPLVTSLMSQNEVTK